ncbi:ATP-binding protein [Lipingzhangella sp. LS1_29]|uniref:ATP-binding protein n=1 Tax=Lipingzhangella rawalii TaxID=2055835 RepID=A0ABU2H3Y4_9ACTN|nr:ATP-binding protein [Lipingzhangella rawalii]MDS1270013.1 ATP-binding protein [Lipingzhangella rawalii]
MAVVQLTISALPAHVRTARLMATSVARRAGIAESTLDEIRLAVGEACSRAVEAHRALCPKEPIQLDLVASGDSVPAELPPTSGGNGAGARSSAPPTHGPGRFEVIVTDRAPAPQAPADPGAREQAVPHGEAYLHLNTPPGGVSGLSPEVGLAVITGLADKTTVDRGDTGTVVRMSWPFPDEEEGADPAGEHHGHTDNAAPG